jgi:hypothetical protein
MNYDFYLLPLKETDDYSSVSERLDETGEPDPADFVSPVDVRLTADLLRGLDPRYEPFVFDYAEIARLMKISVDQARVQLALTEHVEMNGPDGLRPKLCQFLFYPHYVLVHYHSGTADEELWKYCSAICRNAGLSIFDDQEKKIYRLGENGEFARAI